MAPKKNKQREKLEQSLASSSSRAHQLLLANSDANVTMPPNFIGFASFAQPTRNAVEIQAEGSRVNAKAMVQSIYDGSDHEIALMLKMLAKKGIVTKNKALQIFLTEVLPSRQPAEIRPMLGHFMQLYTFEMRDQNDRKVRQLLNEVLAALADKMRPRAFIPHLQRLLPYWYLAMHDINADVAGVAKKAFEKLFPETEMLKNALEDYLPAMLEEYQSFFARTPETFEGIPLQSDEKEERYERCVSAAVLSINAVIKFFGDQDMMDMLNDKRFSCSVVTVVSSDKFTRLANVSSKHPNFTLDIVRRAMYVVFTTLCTSGKSIIAAREEMYGKVILGSLGDKCPANHAAMWNAVLTFLHNFPNVWHSSSSFSNFVSNAVFPRLFAQIRHGFYGSGQSSFPTLLPFLSTVPFSVAVDFAFGRSALYSGVLEQCWKFIDSKNSRFGELPAISAFFECVTGIFSIFLTGLSEDWQSKLADEHFQLNYVNQFENVFKSSLTTTLSSLDFPETGVELYASSLNKLFTRLRDCSMDLDLLKMLKEVFTEKIHAWTRQAIVSMVAKSSFVPSRICILIRISVNDARESDTHEAAQWLLTSTELYLQCLDLVDNLVAEPALIPAKITSFDHLLEVINGICDAHPLSLLISNEYDTPAETHFDDHYRPVLRVLSKWKKLADDSSLNSPFCGALKLTRPFFIAAKNKKHFLLQLFKDCNIQSGDLAGVSDIIRNGLNFPVTDLGNEQWLNCGSWHRQNESNVLLSDQVYPELKALQAIWQGKLFDDLLMMSIKGSSDDFDANTFNDFIQACLGGLFNSPVVSSDAVVILCHFVIQKGADNTNVIVMQILTHLCELFYKLGRYSSAELKAVESDVYKQLFHLSARGSYRVEARALWDQTVSQNLKKWSLKRTEDFVNELAIYINDLLLADLPAGAVSFNAKLFAAYVKCYIHLGADQTFYAASRLVEKLDAINLRCNVDDQKELFYSRVLLCLGEICEDEQLVDALVAYFVWLASENEVKAVSLVMKFVDLDVTHALTWVVFHSNNLLRSGFDLVEIMESYISFEHMYIALKLSSSILDKVVVAINSLCQKKRKRESEEVRNIMFLCKNQSERATSQNLSLLTQEQHKVLDELSLAVLAPYSTVTVRTDSIQEVVDQNGDWKAESTQIIALSLLSAIGSEKEVNNKVVTALRGLLALCNRDVVAKPEGVLLEYSRFVAEGAKKEANFLSACSFTTQAFVDLSIQESVILHIQNLLSVSSPSVVEIEEWITITNYVAALSLYLPSATSEFRDAWETLARLIVTHALAGKADYAKVTSLKLQTRWKTIDKSMKGDEKQIVLSYPNELLSARLALMNLVSAMYNLSPDTLQKLAVHFREALLSTVLCAISECIEIKASIVTTYVAVASPSQSFELLSLWLGVEKILANALRALRSTLTSVHDVDYINRVVLESFGGIGALASLFNRKIYSLQPMLRVLLYIVATHSGALRLRLNNDTTIDLNADNEVATESALARALIPKALRSALRAVFADKNGESNAGNNSILKKREQTSQQDTICVFLLWDLFLQLFPEGKDDNSTAHEGPSSALIASSLSSYAARHGMLKTFLDYSTALLSQDQQCMSKNDAADLRDVALFDVSDLEKVEDNETWNFNDKRVFQLATHVFFRTVVRLPAMVRSWWNDTCSRATRNWATKYFEDHITPFVLAAELDFIQKARVRSSLTDTSWEDEEMTVKGSRVSREITTTYVKDECALEMVLRVPSSYPLRCVEVECTKRIGIPEDRWRRWVLQIIRVTSSRDGSLLDAVLLWKHNVDKEFEGVEPCPICYSILNPKNMALPSLPCKTCKNKYHNSCLYKWFNQSGKNRCPICMQPFC
ncbi:e3 ubiquitin-protein ligase partial [Plasmopara halstedii]|uniref:E3 ubiquitin-protein ligase listerin n=1 Tax=Plasmopara halstedii TaxID=4781 RepID=A0A0P1ALQ7_PLAHL|nr:e3 ubiquitin-protein ligase partial [Plasmopara halstedii]CEG42089.1 e3 ubiquitin-protein ligase partial [Plasmopara halstedii]